MAKQGGQNFIDITGQIFGRLVVVERAKSDKKGMSKWLCRCQCDKEKIIYSQSLRNGATVSCGCFQKEQLKKFYSEMETIIDWKDPEAVKARSRYLWHNRYKFRPEVQARVFAHNNNRDYHRKHHSQNKERLNKQAREKRKQNPDKYRLLARRYREKHPIRERLRCRAKDRKNTLEISDAYIRKLFSRHANLAYGSDFPKELMEAKRLQIKIYRELEK